MSPATLPDGGFESGQQSRQSASDGDTTPHGRADVQTLYNEEYYRCGCGPVPYGRTEHWLNFFSIVGDQIIRSLRPRKVLDAGCAMGFLVEALWDRGIEAYGIDISQYAISKVRPDMAPYCEVASLKDPIRDRFDLVTCIEVLEHLPPGETLPAIENLCKCTDTILFSSSPTDFAEATHFNVRPTISWLHLFASFGFGPDVLFDAGFLTPHAMLLRRSNVPDDQVLTLFSEHLRYKMSLVSTKNSEAQQQAALRELHRQLETIRAENARLASENGALEQRRGKLTGRHEQLHSDFSALQTQHERLRSDFSALEGRHEQLHSDFSALQTQHESNGRRMSELREEAAGLREHNLRLSEIAGPAQLQLHDILHSPGWKLIQKYRAWRLRRQLSHPRFSAFCESLAMRFLARYSAPKGAGKENEKNQPAVLPQPAQPQAPPASRHRKDLSYQDWIAENEPGAEDLERQRSETRNLLVRPLLSVIVPVYNIDIPLLKACMDSVLHQTYDHWELCIADGSEGTETAAYLSGLASQDSRIHYRKITNGGISQNSNAALDLGSGEFVIFLDHDDSLAPFALFEVASLLNRSPEADLIYSDHDYLEHTGNRRLSPLFKPDWSPEIMFSANYITHLTAVRKSLVDAVGRFDPEMDGAQDWDLFLKVAERTSRISHIAKVLYHWRIHPGSTALAGSAKPYAEGAQLRAINAHMRRIGMPAEAEVAPPGLLHVRWNRSREALVSIIIPTRDKVEMLARCIASLREKTAYHPYEIVIVDTGSEEAATLEYYKTLEAYPNIRILSDASRPFNYSRANNCGAREARGELLLFLNNDVEITNPAWLDELARWGAWSPIGIAGAKLLYPNGTIQQAGAVVGLGGFAGHPFAGCPFFSEGIYGSTGWYRNFLAVTGACMLMRREVFEELGGFDEEFLLCGSDVEIGFRAWKRGYRVMLNPFSELTHYEQQTRQSEQPPEDYLVSYKHYKPYLESGDPFWSPNLSPWKPKIAYRSRDEETSLHFVQRTLEALGYPVQSKPIALPSSPADVTREEQNLVAWFDFSEEDLRHSREKVNAAQGYHQVQAILWFIPAFDYAYYGGIMTILRFARQWHQDHGVRSMFAVCGGKASVMCQRIRAVYAACKDTDVFILSSPKDVSSLPSADAGIITLWTTAYFGLRYQRCRRMFYFIQDYEPAFYRAGAANALAQATYRFGFYGITNTISLRLTYEAEYNGKGFHFNPCVDTAVFHPPDRELPTRRRWQVFCYARPHHPRNAFDLVSAAMRQLKARLGEAVSIVTAGADFDVAAQGLAGIVENRGVLSYEQTAELYRASDAGVALMFSRHPSYIPLELMASGCLVVTNRNHWTEWLLQHEHNCLLTEPSATCLAETIERGLRDEALRRAITSNALALVRNDYSDWHSEIACVYDYICDPDDSLSANRAAPA
jgi:glycosyltransferase involved in cell wall biosynthesis/SAM-dependent methyltransferase